MKQMDEDMNLEQLLARCKELNSDHMISVYYDPDTFHFFINYAGVLPFWIPRGAVYLGRCAAKNVRSGLEDFLAIAVRKLIKEVES